MEQKGNFINGNKNNNVTLCSPAQATREGSAHALQREKEKQNIADRETRSWKMKGKKKGKKRGKKRGKRGGKEGEKSRKTESEKESERKQAQG